MRRTLTALLPLMVASSVMVGCQGLIPGGTGATYGALAFGPVSDANKALLAQAGSAERSAAGAPTAAPMAPSMDAAMPAPMPDRMMMAPIGYWPSGDFELAETSEAKAAGFTGTLAETLERHVRPIVRDWAADASLRAAGGLADDKGVNTAASADGPRPYGDGWRFSFFSPAKLETLSFLVSNNETLVLKQRFKSRTVDILSPQIGSAEVIAIVSKAIKDPNAQASDPEAGRNSSSVGIAMPGMAVGAPTPVAAPAIAVGEPAPGVPAPLPPDGAVSGGSSPAYQPPKEELVYEVPANARWDLNLQPEGNRLVWNVSLQMHMDPSTPVANDAQRIGFGGGWARVDAQTGALLSLERPRKFVFSGGGSSGAEPRPMPMPVEPVKPVPAMEPATAQ